MLFRGLDCWLFAFGGSAGGGTTLLHLKSGLLALFAALLLVIATEPFLLKAAPLSAYRLKIVIPMLANVATPSSQTRTLTHPDMDTSTLISIGVFALLQVVTYLVCLMKIGEIARQNITSQLKLRLMENEENLFDSGLYIGMMGTATALVLQVVGVIPANLLAAYSSNLFGIVCVAIVKIRHVRGYKRQLIIESQVSPVTAFAAPVKA